MPETAGGQVLAATSVAVGAGVDLPLLTSPLSARPLRALSRRASPAWSSRCCSTHTGFRP